jgi:thiol-disulfide isomerase/thioredoxin
MKAVSAFIFLLLAFSFSFGQGEHAPIVEKDLVYRDWTYKNVRGDGEMNLRQFAKGKKLVMVVYWSPWCATWRRDLAFVQQLHSKYEKDGLGVIGVGVYDPVSSMKQHLESFKLTFPSVYEVTDLNARTTSVHYANRKAAGDTRNWGSPWYVLLEPSKLNAEGDVLSGKPYVVNGELIHPDVEKFVREKLGLASAGAVAMGGSKEIEICEPSKRPALIKP